MAFFKATRNLNTEIYVTMSNSMKNVAQFHALTTCEEQTGAVH